MQNFRMWENQKSSVRRHDRVLVFIHGWPPKSTGIGCWGDSLRQCGYKGRIFQVRWYAQPREYFRPGLERTGMWNAEALWDWFSNKSNEIRWSNTSIIGFSTGATVTRYFLEELAYNNQKVRRAYLFGAATNMHGRWTQPIRGVMQKLYVFYSSRDSTLKSFCRRDKFFGPDNALGLHGLQKKYEHARSIDCTSIVSSHSEWASKLPWCIRKARIEGENL